MFQVQHWNIDEECQILSISGMMFDIKMCKWHDLYRNNYRGFEDIVHMTTTKLLWWKQNGQKM